MRARLRTLAVATAFAAALAAAPAAQARTGDRLRSFAAANPGNCPASTGLAFDGQRLLITCLTAPTIDVVSRRTGALVRTITVKGRRGLAAAAWDGSRRRLWACDAPAGNSPAQDVDVVLVDPTTGDSALRFPTAGCHDGLAYDGTDDTLWVSPDMSPTVYHYRLDGTLIERFDVVQRRLLGGAGNSGIAVGGNFLLLATPGGEVYQLPKTFAASNLVVRDGRNLEDLECDGSSFSPRNAVWVQEASSRRLDAFEVPARTCGTGGLPPPPLAGRTVVYRLVSGQVFIRYPAGQEPPFAGSGTASSAARAAQTGFIPFRGAANVPLGSTVDTRRGRIAVTAAADLRGRTQRADFFAGIFTLRQSRGRRPTTDVRLASASFRRSCRGRGARAAQSRKVLGRLFGRGRGRFRTRGRFAAATVRGTTWLTEDRCDGTLIRVTSGRVAVFDRGRRRTVVVRAGRSYLARATRAAIRRLGLG
jgi:hypothetical protein